MAKSKNADKELKLEADLNMDDTHFSSANLHDINSSLEAWGNHNNRHTWKISWDHPKELRSKPYDRGIVTTECYQAQISLEFSPMDPFTLKRNTTLSTLLITVSSFIHLPRMTPLITSPMEGPISTTGVLSTFILFQCCQLLSKLPSRLQHIRLTS
jgi:hypothetical protein